MAKAVIAQSPNPQTPTQPSGGVEFSIPIEMIVIVAISGVFSLFSGLLSWMAMQLYKGHQKNVEQIATDLKAEIQRTHTLEVEVKGSYLPTAEFTRQTMITTHQLETLADRISNLGILIAEKK